MSTTPSKRRVLFLCTGNSCRSQMAEGLLQSLAGDRYESLSAGANPAGYVHPQAIEVMKELGVDLSRNRSKHIRDFLPDEGTPPDLVISVCDSASRECPTFPGKLDRLHWPFFDPAHSLGNAEEKLAVFRQVRDQIREQLEKAIEDGELG